MEHAPPPPPQAPPPAFDPAPSGVSDDEKMKALIGHLIPLLNYATGILGVVALIVMYAIMREQSRWLGNQLRQSLYLMILAFGLAIAITCVGLVAGFITCGIGWIIMVPFLAAVVIGELVLRIIAAVKSYAGEDYVYPIVGSWTFLP